MNIDRFVLGLLILLAVLVVAVIIIYLINEWLNRRQAPVSVVPFIPPENFPERPEYYRGPLYGTAIGTAIVETNSGFSEGVVIGSIMASQPPTVINETVVNETVVNEAPVVSQTAFESFDGGDNDGGGATSSWDTDGGSTGSSDSSSDSTSDSSDTSSDN